MQAHTRTVFAAKSFEKERETQGYVDSLLCYIIHWVRDIMSSLLWGGINYQASVLFT
jgi:hypothetical protein